VELNELATHKSDFLHAIKRTWWGAANGHLYKNGLHLTKEIMQKWKSHVKVAIHPALLNIFQGFFKWQLQSKGVCGHLNSQALKALKRFLKALNELHHVVVNQNGRECGQKLAALRDVFEEYEMPRIPSFNSLLETINYALALPRFIPLHALTLLRVECLINHVGSMTKQINMYDYVAALEALRNKNKPSYWKSSYGNCLVFPITWLPAHLQPVLH
jgi:hypothetical protein